MNDDLERLEDLCKDIVKFRAGNPTKAQLWDCIERLGQEILVLRLQHETFGQPSSDPGGTDVRNSKRSRQVSWLKAAKFYQTTASKSKRRVWCQ